MFDTDGSSNADANIDKALLILAIRNVNDQPSIKLCLDRLRTNNDCSIVVQREAPCRSEFILATFSSKQRDAAQTRGSSLRTVAYRVQAMQFEGRFVLSAPLAALTLRRQRQASLLST
jgi:hypothetical protein